MSLKTGTNKGEVKDASSNATCQASEEENTAQNGRFVTAKMCIF